MDLTASGHIDQSALSPQTWPFDLQWLPQPAYLVGGGVRDALRGHPASYLDLDFVLPENSVEIAQAIAHHYKAGFVLLDAQRQIARVVFKHATADFALQVGPSLGTDLQRRDFTINAIAYDPHTKQIIDPFNGNADIKQQVIRMIASQNLEADPLRLLRAYRQAAQLEFHLEPQTQQVIRQIAPQLQQVAAERVRLELSYLLSSSAGTPWLTAAWRDGLLQFWFPAASAQGLAQIAAIDQAANWVIQAWPCLKSKLLSRVNSRATSGEASHRTLLATAKLTGLISSKPEQAEIELWHLKYSRAEIQLVTTLLKLLPQIQSPASLANLSRKEQYFLFQAIGPAFPVLVVLATALGISAVTVEPLVERFITPNDPIAHPSPLVTGRDLIDSLHLRPGRQIGKLLTALEVAQAEGKISTPDEALKLAAELSSQY